jgi:hypothetical protein
VSKTADVPARKGQSAKSGSTGLILGQVLLPACQQPDVALLFLVVPLGLERVGAGTFWRRPTPALNYMVLSYGSLCFSFSGDEPTPKNSSKIGQCNWRRTTRQFPYITAGRLNDAAKQFQIQKPKRLDFSGHL